MAEQEKEQKHAAMKNAGQKKKAEESPARR